MIVSDRVRPASLWFESVEWDGRGLLSVGCLLLLLPFGFKQICLFVEVWLAVGSSAGKAAAFNCALLWWVGGRRSPCGCCCTMVLWPANTHTHVHTHWWVYTRTYTYLNALFEVHRHMSAHMSNLHYLFIYLINFFFWELNIFRLSCFLDFECSRCYIWQATMAELLNGVMVSVYNALTISVWGNKGGITGSINRSSMLCIFVLF